MTHQPSPTGIGASVRRVEDLRFVRGRGRYTDDINLPGQTYCAFVRSPHAHARISRIDATKAKSAPGVVMVITAAELTALGGLPCGWLIHNQDGSPMCEPKHPVLAEGKVNHVGDPVVAVIAETLAQARDAAELIDVNYDVLPAVVDMEQAIAGAAAIHAAAPTNLCYDWHLGDAAATDAAIAKAAHVATLDLVNNRLAPNAIEPRCYIGDYNVATGEHTLFTSNQNPHVIRLLMGAFVLQAPEHKIRVVAPDVGGGFGSKIYHYAEEAVVTWAAAQLGRPVKWTSDRSEAFVSDAQGRDHKTRVELALDADGRFTALRVRTLANMGAYLSTFASVIPTYLHGTLLAGNYTTPAISVGVKAVFTNTVPVDAYRGAGRPEATYLLERVIDLAAAQTGRDPAELRRLNFIKPSQFPYQTPVALTYDTGNYERTLDMALAAADYGGFPARRSAAKARGKLRGIGIASYIEACGIAPSNVAGALGSRAGGYECGTIRVNPTGSVTVLTGSHSHGQGHETTFAQLVSDKLGVPFDMVEVVHGDTAKIPFGMGTYGSRSLAVGGSALDKAGDKIIAKGKKIAAHMLEVSEQDIEFANGAFKVAGTDRQKTFADVAFQAYVPHNFPLETIEPGLEETAFYDPKNFTYPAGVYVCEVEIDSDTGAVTIVNFCAADDFGKIINPMIVEGQVHGGLAQGIGQALLEHCVYDRDGQLVTGSYMDYAMPRADDLPMFKVETTDQPTPCTHNPLGVKGCGEAGAIGSPPAVINAIVNALAEFGVTHVDMPATPQAVWRAIHHAKKH
ncbi:MAG: xanthine dehydrogenase family protein molybdopterin-binding subunit [Rhodospirillaceae bacterium]|nr:xanthine dehydrogenase family protein molybdopterin-binding subunit [Rhodospirillaceae bacterium]